MSVWDDHPDLRPGDAVESEDVALEPSPVYTGKFGKSDFVRKYVEEGYVYDPVLRAWRLRGSKTRTPPGRFDPADGWTRSRVFEVLRGRRAKPKFREAGKPEPADEFEKSFTPFRDLLHKMGVTDGEILAVVDEVGWANESVDHVRHEVKLRFRDRIVKKLSDPGRARMQAKWASHYDWKGKPEESYDAARRR